MHLSSGARVGNLSRDLPRPRPPSRLSFGREVLRGGLTRRRELAGGLAPVPGARRGQGLQEARSRTPSAWCLLALQKKEAEGGDGVLAATPSSPGAAVAHGAAVCQRSSGL